MFRAMRKMRKAGERGSAVMELSLSLPILLGVTAGVVEFGHAFQLRQNLVSVAYEATRVGTQLACPRPTESEVLAATRSVLTGAGLSPDLARIELTNTGGEPGSEMVVTVAYDAYLPVLAKVMHLTLPADGRYEVSVEVAGENE